MVSVSVPQTVREQLSPLVDRLGALRECLSFSKELLAGGEPGVLLRRIAPAYKWSVLDGKDLGDVEERVLALEGVTHHGSDSSMTQLEVFIFSRLWELGDKVDVGMLSKLALCPDLVAAVSDVMRKVEWKPKHLDRSGFTDINNLVASDLFTSVFNSIPAPVIGLAISDSTRAASIRDSFMESFKLRSCKTQLDKVLQLLRWESASGSASASTKKADRVWYLVKTTVEQALGTAGALEVLLSDAAVSVLPTNFDIPSGHDVLYRSTWSIGSLPQPFKDALSYSDGLGAACKLSAAAVMKWGEGFKVGCESVVDDGFVKHLNDFHCDNAASAAPAAGAGAGAAAAPAADGKIRLLRQGGLVGSGAVRESAFASWDLKQSLCAIPPDSKGIFPDFARLRKVFSPLAGKDVWWPTVVGEVKTHSTSIIGAVPQFHAYVCAVLRGLSLAVDVPCHLGRIVAGGSVRYFASWLDVDPTTKKSVFHTVPVTDEISVVPPGECDKDAVYAAIGRFEAASAWLAEQQEGELCKVAGLVGLDRSSS